MRRNTLLISELTSRHSSGKVISERGGLVPETTMLRRSAAVEFALEIASPSALFFRPARGTVRLAGSTVVPAARYRGRASVNALGPRFEVRHGPPRFPILWPPP
jgi:hypothetical protein